MKLKLSPRHATYKFKRKHVSGKKVLIVMSTLIAPYTWERLLQYGYTPWIVLTIILLFANGPINRLLKLGKYPHEPSFSAVVITGCDSGFGLYMSQKLRKLGYVVISTCFTAEGCAHLNKQGVHTVQLDLTKPGAYDVVAKTTQTALDATPGARLWAVINNAGVAPMGFLDWLSVDMFRWVGARCPVCPVPCLPSPIDVPPDLI
jgi:hypothetical protein